VTSSIEEAVARIRAWGERRAWCGYDPYDGLSSPLAPALSLGTPLGRRVLVQAVKRSPLNLRPLLLIPPGRNAKAIGLIASAYARLWAATGDETARREGGRWLHWLLEHHRGGAAGTAWGYNFDVQTRFFAYGSETPNTIATSFAAHALLDGVSLLEDERWTAGVRSTVGWLRDRALADGTRGAYFRYVPREGELVHNANLLACGVLARAATVLEDAVLLEPAASALGVSLEAQRADGSWPYSDGPAGRWVDNFHTGYVLESLAHCAAAGMAVGDALDRGFDYWERELFLADGTPKYTPTELYPIDAHCYATAVDTWMAVSNVREEALPLAERTARLLVERMLDPRGFVRFQQCRFWTSAVPFVRWTTAPAFKALAGLLLARRVSSVVQPGELSRARVD
jgi:hypothetical protein